jgi:hypothetical protein
MTGRTRFEECKKFTLIYHLHEVSFTIKLAVPAASGGADS